MLIHLTGVTKSYQSTVLDNVNLQIKKGDFLYVVGDSGAGKTTLLKLFYGEETPNRGSVEIFGENISRLSTTDLQKTRRRMGVIFQDLRLVDDLTVFDNIALSLQTSQDKTESTKTWRRMIDDVLGLVGISKLYRKKVKLLSGGEKQRVAAARALVRSPEILIADEPTGSLDHEHTWGLMDILQKLHYQGTTVVVATHDRDIVRKVRRRSCLLRSGKIIVEEGVGLF